MCGISVGKTISSSQVSEKAGLDASAPLFKRSRGSDVANSTEDPKKDSKITTIGKDIGSSFEGAIKAPLQGVYVAAGLAMRIWGKSEAPSDKTEVKATEKKEVVSAGQAFSGSFKAITGGFFSSMKTLASNYSSTGSTGDKAKTVLKCFAAFVGTVVGAPFALVGGALVGAAKAVVAVAESPATAKKGRGTIKNKIIKEGATFAAKGLCIGAKFLAKVAATVVGGAVAIVGGLVVGAGKAVIGLGKIALQVAKPIAVAVVSTVTAAATFAGAAIVGALAVAGGAMSGNADALEASTKFAGDMMKGAWDVTKNVSTKTAEKVYDTTPSSKTQQKINNITERLDILGIKPEPRPKLTEFQNVEKMLDIAFSTFKRGTMATSGGISGAKQVSDLSKALSTSAALSATSGILGAVGGTVGTVMSTKRVVEATNLSGNLKDILAMQKMDDGQKKEKGTALSGEIKILEKTIDARQSQLDKMSVQEKKDNPNEVARLTDAIGELSSKKNSKEGMKALLDVKLTDKDVAAINQLRRTGTGMKVLGMMEGGALTSGSVITTLVALGVGAAALGPIGLAVTGAAIAVGVGATAYRVHKVMEREDKILTLSGQEKAVDDEIKQLTKDVARPGMNPEIHQGKVNTLQALQGIKSEIQELRARVEPEFAQQMFNASQKGDNLDHVSLAIFGKSGSDVKLNDIPIYSGVVANKKTIEVSLESPLFYMPDVKTKVEMMAYHAG